MSLDTDILTSNSLMSRMKSIVLHHLDREDFDVETFAEEAGLSRSELYRKIKKNTGKSVTQFIRDIRLQKSLEFLSDGEHTASETAYKVGFNSATYFNKCFKEKYGFTPGDTEAHREEIFRLLNQPEPLPKKSKSLSKIVILIVVLLSAAGVVISIFFSQRDSSAEETPTEQTVPSSGKTNIDATVNGLSNNSVAILPMLNWTGDESLDFICFGVTDAIISRLTDLNTVDRIAPMSAVIPYKDSIQALHDIASQLDVENILHGSVQKAGSQLKFSVQLINILNNDITWSDDFIIDWVPEEAFKMQSKIANEVVMALGVDSRPYLHNDAPTSSKKAYDYFLQGFYQYNIFTKASWENSIHFFNKAIEEDPEYLQAYIYLAFTWHLGGLIWSYTTQEEAWTNYRKYLEMALTLDPDNTSIPVYLRDGYFYYELNAADRIPEISGVTAKVHMATNSDYALKTGRYEEALAGNTKWLKQEPFSGAAYALLAIDNYFIGNTSECRALLDDNYDLYKDDLNFLRETAKAYYFLGDHEKMREAVNYFFENFKERPPIMRWLKAIAADQQGDTETVKAQLAILQESYHEGRSGSPAWFLALYEARNGNYEMALEWLERSYAAREVEMTWLAQEPDLAPLGNHPRYRALLDSMQFPPVARKHVNNSIIIKN
ncbi:helix-turn-helix domain-containing protein [Robertkochia marina]|uniref:Helix-turn-helix domain-containing protein n=1 Tax=Robertkochia marina TaxID=1227945 RepID=A0A4S3M1F2_9FLAO|nr:helix-turn-helix domain-containing protein [Robertkochia marina]THD67853.1 helix-turn-helix domain-containing protein [Robertkochia marina]TRZ42108.1 helix-turn-helix domain-containing protein [Robertkochia marina]